MEASRLNPARRISAIALATTLFLILLVPTARAADSIYWVNYGADRISHANIGGGGGGDIPISAAHLDGPYGMAIDSVSGKVYWLNSNGAGSIGYAALNGSGSDILNTPGATFASPAGLAIDPVGKRVYWGNPSNHTIGFANLDGSGAFQVGSAGATNEPNSVAIDPAQGRIYWTNFVANKISYLDYRNGTGGADIDTTGAPVNGPEGIAVDPISNRVYWTNFSGGSIGYASLNGGGGGTLDTGGAPVSKPVGIAIDPFSNYAYWANEGNDTIAYASLNGGPKGQVETNGATLKNVAFPLLLQRPRNTEFPTVQGQHRPGTTLNCTQGTWRGDLPESFLYLAPQTYAYQWFRNGQPITDATASSVVANKVGAYSCIVTATNFAGSDYAVSPVDFSVNATVGFKKVTYNRKKGTATLRVAVTGTGRIDLYGKGVANVTRKKATGTAKLIVRASGKARIKLAKTGRAKVKARISYTPEGGKAIKRFKAVVLKKRRG